MPNRRRRHSPKTHNRVLRRRLRMGKRTEYVESPIEEFLLPKGMQEMTEGLPSWH